MDRVLARYLQHYAEAEAHSAAAVPGHWRSALVVPLYRESETTFERLRRWLQSQNDFLLIVVFNRPETGPGDWARPLFEAAGAPRWRGNCGRLRLHDAAGTNAILSVDRCLEGPPLPPKQGVGLARRIGTDIACALLAQGSLQNRWIGQSDADATLPEDYCDALGAVPAGHSACVFPFRHTPEHGQLPLPALIHEFQMLYYVLGLAYACSPYAFPTIGSAMAVEAGAYTRVRGFPRRAGAEDFYLLNKLAKLKPVACLQTPEILVEARASDRVPFGTGPALQKLASNGDLSQAPCYHPKGFELLRRLQRCVQKLLEAPTFDAAHATRELRALDAALAAALLAPGWLDALHHCHRQGRDPAARLRHWHTWFDGFRTLKLLHQLRDNSLGTVPLQQLLRSENWLTTALDQGESNAADWMVSRLRVQAEALRAE